MCYILTIIYSTAFLQSNWEASEQQWAAQLAAHDFEVKYWPGRSHKNAKALTWHYLSADGSLDHILYSEGTSISEPGYGEGGPSNSGSTFGMP